MLLDQRLRLTTGTAYPWPKRLDELFAAYCAPSVSKDTRAQERSAETRPPDSFADRENQVIEEARMIAAVYGRLREEVPPVPRFFAQFGHCGVGIDVQGAVALAMASRHGLWIDPEAAVKLDRSAEAQFRTL
jgi:hypothetical protein